MEKNYKGMQSESYALREYVVTLQSRLLDAVGEFPAPPPNVNLGPPAPTEPPMNNQETASHSLNAGTPLEAVAQAVAGLAAQEQMNDRHQYTHQPLGSEQSTQDTRTADEINRHLQSSEEVKPPVV
jgi:osmotically-inducible protein OsmY